MSLLRLPLAHLQGCPWNCPAMYLPTRAYVSIIGSTAIFASLNYFLNNSSDRELLRMMGENVTDVRVHPYEYYAKAAWALWTKAIPTAIWTGVKAGTYAAIYPAIAMYNSIHRSFTQKKE